MPPDLGLSSGRSSSFEQTLEALSGLCASLQPGERVPTHTELMRRFSASERMVLRALDELQRAGALVRRRGAGTFVADRSAMPAVSPPPAHRSHIVAVALPESTFFQRCLSLFFRCIEPDETDLVCRILSPESCLSLVPPAGPYQPVGFVFFSYEFAPRAKQLREAGSRVVVVGTPPAGELPDVPCVYGDHEQGGYLATSHLLELGHRRLAFAGRRDPEKTVRWLGHQRALREVRQDGREIQDTVLTLEETLAWSRDPQLAADYFRRPDAPTALVVWNDHEAAKLLSVLTRAGLRVPEDVSLVGYDALPEGKLVHPQLATVDQGIGRQLQAALTALTAPTVPPVSQTVVMPSLVVRHSSIANKGT